MKQRKRIFEGQAKFKKRLEKQSHTGIDLVKDFQDNRNPGENERNKAQHLKDLIWVMHSSKRNLELKGK